jgi:hypothetical protein
MICADITYHIVFSGSYSFAGAMNIRYTYSPRCGVSNCYVNYMRIGKRVHE